MLDFFRTYQRYFFLVITVVIIISFSFFGTYSTLGSNHWREQVAFKAINGHEVKRADLDEMALFLATDNEDKTFFGGIWGPNFLNDGVIRNDFLQTGLGEELALAYSEDLQEELNKRSAKEKRNSLYAHPQAPFVGVQSVWNYFAPQMSQNYRILKEAENPLSKEAFQARINLYLAQKQLPPATLRYILKYQEKQYSEWLKPDEKLGQIDLSLFGYHKTEDWFGPNFTRLISEFVINAAIIAEEQGYEVSNDEALASLIHNTEVSYEQNQNNPHLGVASPEEYLNEQLRILNIDQAKAVKIWRQVLLFRRFFGDASSTALVDALTSKKLNHFAKESVEIDLYRLPPALQLANYQDLQAFEIYLAAVAAPNKQDKLALPSQFLTLDQVAKKYPQLVQRRYLLEVASATQKQIEAKITLKQLWDFELETDNWQKLVVQFPILATEPSKTREERFETLENLAPSVRSVVDAFARQEMIKANKEWVLQALSEAKVVPITAGLRLEGGKWPFTGLDNQEKRKELLRLLDQAQLGSAIPSDSPLYDFSADDKNYYRIAVIERAQSGELLTFEEAKTDGTLDEMKKTILEQHYVSIRSKDASLYQNEKKEWKPFKEVSDSVADDYFKKTIAALEVLDKKISGPSSIEISNKNRLATLRFYPYFENVQKELKQDKNKETLFVAHTAQASETNQLPLRSPLQDQWKLEKSTVKIDRQNRTEGVNPSEALALENGSWSSIQVTPNGLLALYAVKERLGGVEDNTSLIAHALSTQSLIGAEVKRHLMQKLIEEIQAKHAISLAYLKTPLEESETSSYESVEE